MTEREFRSRCARKFFSHFLRRRRRELDWASRLSRVGLANFAGSSIGKAPQEMEKAASFAFWFRTMRSADLLTWMRFRVRRGKHENDSDCGRRTGGALRIAARARIEVSDCRSRFGGDGARRAGHRAAGFGVARCRDAGTKRDCIFAVDARTRSEE